MSEAKDWSKVLLNTDGEDLIYETPGDAERGNPLDIVTVGTAFGGEDITGLKFPKKAVAKRLALCWNTHDELLAGCKDMIDWVRAYYPRAYGLDLAKWETVVAKAEKGHGSS